MQPYFFPYAGYFRLLAAADRFIILDTVQFPRRGWVHRNCVHKDGKENWITLPIKKCPRDTLIKDLKFRPDADEWFALYRDDGVIDDQTYIADILRDHFRLHDGTRSEGCITLDGKNFDRLRELLLNTKKDIIPDTNIDYYGTVEVR